MGRGGGPVGGGAPLGFVDARGWRGWMQGWVVGEGGPGTGRERNCDIKIFDPTLQCTHNYFIITKVSQVFLAKIVL